MNEKERKLRKGESGRNKTDEIYIRNCFGFIDINIYSNSDLALCYAHASVYLCLVVYIFSFDLSFSILLAFCAVTGERKKR